MIAAQFLTALLSLALAAPAWAELRIAALHPILGDLARQVGGTAVSVVDLMSPGSDVHHFEPTARMIADARGARLVLASGKNLESYLDKLRDNLGAGVKIVEVGRSVPSLRLSAETEVFHSHTEHETDGIDPHWWHSAEHMERAARVLAAEFGEADPANKAAYKANALAAQEKIASLKSWARQQIALIPKPDRKLVTGHAAFGYFCHEFGFKSIPVLGLSREDTASGPHIAEAIKIIRDNRIRAVFPEDQANPKVLMEITRETGAKIGRPLVADGTSIKVHTFEALLKHNVESIVEALKP